jgi:pimeloyl-ACP methyl ester carboxylesterase
MTTTPATHQNWFTYFPESYRWSASIMGMISSSAYGAADIGEIDRAGRELRAGVGDDHLWFDVWTRTAERVIRRGEEAMAAGHRLTAAGAFLRACTYDQMAERFRWDKDDATAEAFARGVDSFHRYAELTDRPRIEVVEVPYEDGHLPAYFVPAEPAGPGRRPCLVFFDGLDITKELQFSRGVPDLIRRGISCLVVDGPGTGESIRFRGYHLRPDYEVAGTAALDYLLGRDDVDPERIGVMGLSLGGYYAPRCAAMDDRFRACVAWGAIWDYRETWRRRIDRDMKLSLSVPGHHIQWVLGVESYVDALERLAEYRLDGVVQRMSAAFLVTHGEQDEQIPLADAQHLYDACGSPDKTLRVFTEAEGGAQHCQRDYPSHGRAVIFDWLADRLCP